jgi:hypothetical protein
VAGRRTFRILTSSQQSGIYSKAQILSSTTKSYVNEEGVLALPLTAMTRAEMRVVTQHLTDATARGYICDSPTNKSKHIVMRQQLRFLRSHHSQYFMALKAINKADFAWRR